MCTYEAIWYETPSSRYAQEAWTRAKQYREADQYPARVLSVDQRYDFIKALRKAAQHGEAIKEIQSFRQTHATSPKCDAAFFLEAMSAHALRRDTETVTAVEDLRRQFPKSQWVASAAIYAIKSWRRSDNTAEVRQWARWIVNAFPKDDKALEALYELATYLTYAGLASSVPAEHAALLEESAQTYEDLIHKGEGKPVVAEALWKFAWLRIHQDDYRNALGLLENLLARFPDSGYRSAGLYWVGKLRHKLNNKQSAVENWRKVVVEEPYTYYGYRAQEKLSDLADGSGPVGGTEVFPDIDLRRQFPGNPSIDLVLALREVGLYEFAAVELQQALGKSKNPAVEFALADLTTAGGSPTAASDILQRSFKVFIKEGGREVPKEFWQILYPLHHWSLIQREAQSRGIDPWLVAALVRNESYFDAGAVSPVGAIGLMQLMPEAAAKLAPSLGIPSPTQSDLYDPELNIRLGVFHLSEVLKRLAGDREGAICAYNAGDDPVRGWLGTKTADNTDEWIEAIPYLATRLYLKRVLADVKEYKRIYEP